MANPLIIRINKTNTHQIQWIPQESGNTLSEVSQQGNWEQLDEIANKQEVILIVPSTDVTLHTVSMPNINRRKLGQAIPFALEDKLADNIEDLHFAFSKMPNSNEVLVAIVSNTLMQNWHQILQSHHLTAKFILPEALLLPIHNDGWTIVIDDKMAYLRTDNGQSIAVDVTALTETVKSMLDSHSEFEPSVNDDTQANTTQKIHIYVQSAGVNDALLQDLNCDIQIHELTQAVINLLAQHISQATPLNLLQGKYQATHKTNHTMWYISACLGGALILSLFMAKIVENNKLNHKLSTLEQNIKQHYQQIFPNATTVPTSAQRQIQQKLDELSGNVSNRPFLPLLAYVGEAIQQSPGVRLNSLSFNNKALTVNIESNTVNTIDIMTRALQSRPLKIISNTVSTDGNIAKAVLVMTVEQ